MVKEETVEGKKYLKCEACDISYFLREKAKECEDFCNKNNASSTRIIKSAVNPGK